MAIKLIIVGLRRSGTTVYWETFRQDRRLLCYDEPFNPLLLDLAGYRRSWIKNPEEFDRLLERDAQEFWRRFASIDPAGELGEDLSDRQAAYLRFLGDNAEHVMMDVTRCHFKIAALKEHAPEAALVHLYRPPAANVTSHMLPTNPSRFRSRIRRWLNSRDFWTRTGKFDYWHFESLVGNSLSSPFAQHMREAGLDPSQVYSLPAVGRLLAFWRVNFDRVERDGPRHFGDRFVSQNFNEFCRDPRGAVARVYETLKMPVPQLDFGRIRPAKPAYEPTSEHWSRYAKMLQLPEV